MNQELDIYYKVVNIPYYRECNFNQSILNMYCVPQLMFYQKQKECDIQKHPIWTLLIEIMCDSDEYKIKWLFNYIAMKIQQPDRKVEKILTLVSKVTGCGKSSFYHFMAHLLGYDKCFELVNVDQLKDKFNAHLEGKLLILVDDIQQLSKKAQQNLKTTCTQKNFKLEKKGIDSYLVKAYYDVILTSNDEKSLWVDNEDRRSEIVQVNTKYKNNGDESKTRFWKEFNDGLGDMCLMKQYWEFFASYQIDLEIRSKGIRFDQNALSKHVSKSIPRSVEFLRTLFAEKENFNKPYEVNDVYLLQSGHLLVTKKMLYVMFKDWFAANGFSTPPTSITFYDQMVEIGFVYKIRRFGTKRTRVWVLSPMAIKENVATVYGNVEVEQEALVTYLEDFGEGRKYCPFDSFTLVTKEKGETLFGKSLITV